MKTPLHARGRHGGGGVHLGVQRAQGYAVIEVADDGIGIPADALPHVFHGGGIEVISTVGMGSTFRWQQPLAVDAPLRA